MGNNNTSLLCSVHGKEVFYAAKRGGEKVNRQQNFLAAGILPFQHLALFGIKVPVPIQSDP